MELHAVRFNFYLGFLSRQEIFHSTHSGLIKVSTEIIRLNIMADSGGVSFTLAIFTKVERKRWYF